MEQTHWALQFEDYFKGRFLKDMKHFRESLLVHYRLPKPVLALENVYKHS